MRSKNFISSSVVYDNRTRLHRNIIINCCLSILSEVVSDWMNTARIQLHIDYRQTIRSYPHHSQRIWKFTNSNRSLHEILPLKDCALINGHPSRQQVLHENHFKLNLKILKFDVENIPAAPWVSIILCRISAINVFYEFTFQSEKSKVNALMQYIDIRQDLQY